MARSKAAKNTSSKSKSTRSGGSNIVALHPAGTQTQPQQTVATVSSKPATFTHEQIARRAHEIWVKRGRRHGEDRQNWVEAEAQLKAELAGK